MPEKDGISLKGKVLIANITKHVLYTLVRGVVLVVAVALALFKVAHDVTYFSGYDAAAPLNAEIVRTEETPDYVRTTFYYSGFRNARVPAVLVTPKDRPGPLPCIIFLHGMGNDKDFMAKNKLDLPFVQAGFAFACFDQFMDGERGLKNASTLKEADAFRVRAAYTVNDTRRLIDYLVTRPDIASDRIYLGGASYGAIAGATVAAFDKRIRAAVLTYGGGGGMRKLLAGPEIANALGKWRIPVVVAGWYLGSVSDPVRYVGQIAPRPVLLQNGKDDAVVSPAAGQALQDAAREPKTVIWYEGGHLDHFGRTSALDLPLATRVLSDALKFIQEQDAKAAPAS